jgi:hypothetical protein
LKSIGVGRDANWRAKLLIDQVMEGVGLFAIECAEGDSRGMFLQADELLSYIFSSLREGDIALYRRALATA